MLDNGRISSVQLLLLLITIDLSTSIIYMPRRVVEIAGTGAWLSVSILPSLYGLLVAGAVLALAKRFPLRVFTEYLPIVLGKISGKLLAAAYTLYLVLVIALVSSECTTFVCTAFMHRTPTVIFDVLWTVVAVYGAYLGIECIVRNNGLFVPVLVAINVLLFIFLAKDINLNNIKPFFENGLLPAIKAAPLASSWRGYLAFMLMLFPYLNQKQEATKTAFLYLLLAAIISGIFLLTTLGVFGAQVISHLTFPFETLTEYVSVANFIERFEIMLFVSVWISVVIIKLAFFYHVTAISAATTLGLKSYRVTLVPIAVIAITLARVLFGTLEQLLAFLFNVFPLSAAITDLAIPAVILLVAVIRKKSDQESAA